MGQVLSNIVRCLCGDQAGEDQERPSETLLLCPALPSKPGTSAEELLQTRPSFPLSSSDSCSDSGASYASIPPSDVDEIAFSTISHVSHQNLSLSGLELLLSLPSKSDVDEIASSTNSHVSPSSESVSNHDDSISDAQLGLELLLSLPCLESFLRDSSTKGSLDPAVVADSNFDVVEKKKQVLPLLSQENLEKPRERDEEREQAKVSKAVVVKEIWMKHYSSCHKILLVGEGDFSFSASLAVAFGSAANITATSLNSIGYLRRNYRNAMSNIQSLSTRGATVRHGVDATEMEDHFLFRGLTFDRIVYNFPHAGFFPNESRESVLHRYRELVCQFMANARKMITEKGEIHITHKSNGFFLEWNLEQLASSEGLRLIEKLHFNYTDYPGYRTKYGFGGDKNFNCNPSKTYKFGLN